MYFKPKHQADPESEGTLVYEAGRLTRAGAKKLVYDIYKRIYGVGDGGIEALRVLHDLSSAPDSRYKDSYPVIKLDKQGKNAARTELGCTIDALNARVKGLCQANAMAPVHKSGNIRYHIKAPHPDTFEVNMMRLIGVEIRFELDES